MRIIADFHIHSKYSRAVSKNMDLPHISEWCKYKGINLIGTGDFTHPVWFRDIQKNLVEDGSGFLRYRSSDSENSENFSANASKNNYIRFILTVEISSIYKQGDKVRKIHTLIFVPDLKTAAKINMELDKVGNIKSDGRPILGLPVKELTKLVLNINPNCLVVPAHAWTPWFGLLGSKSGFDSIEECFEELTPNIYSIETGLSSDPTMNWQLSSLDKIALISNSDAHSPANLGREANVFEIDKDKFTYNEIIGAIKNKEANKLKYTIEFYPEEGKYHFDGDASCKQSIDPTKTKVKVGDKSLCGNLVTVGVLHRVEDLADRPFGFQPKNVPGQKHLVPLREIIGSAYGVGVQSKKVQNEYMNLVNKLGSEFNILLDLSEKELTQNMWPRIAEGIMKVRKGDIYIEPGYDGIYGKVQVFKDNGGKVNQSSLF